MKNLIPILLILILFACKPEPERIPDKHNYFYLTAEQLAKTPYFTNPAFDTLTFVSNQNDTVVFAKTKVDGGWYKQSDIDIGREYDIHNYYQQRTAKYQTIKGVGSFEVMHGKEHGNSVENISLKIQESEFKLYPGWFDPKFGYEFFTKDTIINKISYQNVIKVIELNTTKKVFILVDIKHGVIKFQDLDSDKSMDLLNF